MSPLRGTRTPKLWWSPASLPSGCAHLSWHPDYSGVTVEVDTLRRIWDLYLKMMYYCLSDVQTQLRALYLSGNSSQR